MRIAVTGASGFLGTQLSTSFRRGGHTVLPVVRQRPAEGEIGWDPAVGTIESSKLEGLDAVVHLAGENIATRWSEEARTRIRESRVKGTGLLASALAGLGRKPELLISISAVGYYGDRGEEMVTEASGPGSGFLAEVAQAWEAAAGPARAAGIRVVHPRLGMVLGGHGGALDKMLPPFKLGLGGKLSTGNQWMSWIALDDVSIAMHHILAHREITGPVNLTAPEAVRNREFTRVLAQELHRPALFTVPKAALYLRYGKAMVEEVLLASTRVVPTVLPQAGFTFQLPTLRPAIAHALGGRP